MANFKKIREQKGIKQSDVAQVLGITKQAYSDYELGKREAGYATLIRLADFFGVSVDDLIRSSNLQEHFFDNVCYFLRCKGLTVTILTNELGIERKTFYNWQDKGDLPLSKALQIAKFLDVPLPEILKARDKGSTLKKAEHSKDDGARRKNPLTPYGITVNVKLMNLGQNQRWLIEKLNEELPERYIDSSVVNRILTGRLDSPEITAAIDRLLGISEETMSTM
jgi:transcriptional regulator with XRE-family HTH domain